MIKSIIFDLNGVFIQSPKLSDRFLRDFGVEEAVFMPALKEVMHKVRMPGAGDAYEYWRPYLKEWNVKLNHEEFFDYWFKAEKENVGMIELARELKSQGTQLFILSNNFKERTEYYENTFSFLSELFQKVYFSWRTGLVKPDEQYYQLILEENKLNPEECMYFDDSEFNVEVAKKVGMQSYIFHGAEEVKNIFGKG